MRRRGDGSPGFTLYELLLVVAMLAILAAITIPVFSLVVARARSSGVAEALGATIRDARTRAAIAAGFQYRVRAFNTAGNPPNAFRLEGMNPNVGVWPLPTDTNPPALYGVVQMYEPYVNLAQEFAGTQILIPGGGNEFRVTFNNNGQVAACIPANCQVQVVSGERAATITVSAAGAVLIVK